MQCPDSGLNYSIVSVSTLSCPVLSRLFLIPKSLVYRTFLLTLTISPATDIIFFADVVPPLTSLYLYLHLYPFLYLYHYLYLYLFTHAFHCISE